MFEITDKAGNVVDTIRSDSRGRAVSKLLPLSRYTVREVKAPDYYAVNPTVMNAYLEYEGQIVTFEVEDESIATGVNIKRPARPGGSGQPIQYAIFGLGSTSTVPLSSFYWRDACPPRPHLPGWSPAPTTSPLPIRSSTRPTSPAIPTAPLADNLSTTRNYVLDASPAALGLAANEKVTEFMVVFGQVKAGFAQVETPLYPRDCRPGPCQQFQLRQCGGCGRPLHGAVDHGGVPLGDDRVRQAGAPAPDGLLNLTVRRILIQGA